MSIFICIIYAVSIFFSTVSASFEPYIDHGGTVAGVAGKDYCVIVADTRLSENYMIHSRNITRIMQIGEDILYTAAGCLSDIQGLQSVLQHNARSYLQMNKKVLSVHGFSHLLSTVLYNRRMFPYYSFSILGGIDTEGYGALYKYDALGSCERVRCTSSGKGEHLIQPMLDRLGDRLNSLVDSSLWVFDEDSDSFESPDQNPYFCDNLSMDEARDVLVRAYRAAAEREISIGDAVEVWTITKEKICRDIHRLPQH